MRGLQVQRFFHIHGPAWARLVFAASLIVGIAGRSVAADDPPTDSTPREVVTVTAADGGALQPGPLDDRAFYNV